jgi:DNA-directed RNA polymerase specialized sigma24 family protein
MREAIDQLLAGAITFDRFEQRTRANWSRMASRLWRRWRLPSAVSIEDIRQEMLLGCWRAVARYDPAKASAEQYLVFCAHASAKDWIHCQRNSYRRLGKNPPRFPRCDDLDGDGAYLAPSVPPDQFGRVAQRQRIAHVIAAASDERQRVCVRAFIASEGDLDAAINRVYCDRRVRRLCRFNCRADVRRIIKRAIMAVA